MPPRLGNNKDKRSYLDKGPTKEQLERRNIVRGRLFADESESDDSDFNIPGGDKRMTPRRSRSESRGPSHKRKEKKRSLSTNGLSGMRRSLMRRANSIGKLATATATTTPPPSPAKQSNKQERRTSDDIMSSAIKRVQERRKKKMEDKGVLIETFMMEDKGGVHYDSDDESVCSNSSPNEVTTNIFYRGLQALEQIYLE